MKKLLILAMIVPMTTLSVCAGSSPPIEKKTTVQSVDQFLPAVIPTSFIITAMQCYSDAEISQVINSETPRTVLKPLLIVAPTFKVPVLPANWRTGNYFIVDLSKSENFGALPGNERTRIYDRHNPLPETVIVEQNRLPQKS